MQRFLVFFLYITILVLSSHGFAANIQVQVDRNPVALGESFQVTFSTSESVNGEPDFSPLEKSFSVLGQSSSSKMTLVNGVSSNTVSWTVVLMAEKSGNQLIPPIGFGKDRSRAVKVEVKNAKRGASGAVTASQGIFLEVDVEPKNPYVQAQVIYTMKLYHQVEIAQARLDEPTLGDDAVIEKLGEDTNYRTTRGGLPYHVVERKYAVFPQKSGELKFPPLTLEAQIVTGGRRSGIGAFFGRQNTQRKRLQSNAVTLDVQPIPGTFSGQHWLPAEDIQLSEDWSADLSELKAGVPVTRTIALLAKGMTVGQLPELGVLQPVKSDAGGGEVTLYPDQPNLHEEKEANGIFSFREEKTAMIPSRAGEYTLAAVEIPWWNTKTNKMEIAHLPERVMFVAPDSQSTSTQLPVVNVSRPAVISPLQTAIHPPSSQQLYWKWVALALAFAWLATGLLWWYLHQQAGKSINQPRPKTDEIQTQAAIKKLKQACAKQAPQQAKEALLLWAKGRWPDSPPTSLGAIESRCNDTLQHELGHLNKLLYQRQSEPWSGTALWKAFKAEKQNNPDVSTRKYKAAGGLEPLYKTG